MLDCFQDGWHHFIDYMKCGLSTSRKTWIFHNVDLWPTKYWPEGGVWRLPLHDSEEAREEAFLAITHQASVCVDKSFHLRDVGLQWDGAEFIQFLIVQQEVLVPERMQHV